MRAILLKKLEPVEVVFLSETTIMSHSALQRLYSKHGCHILFDFCWVAWADLNMELVSEVSGLERMKDQRTTAINSYSILVAIANSRCP